MNRIFQARIHFAMYLFVVLLTAGVIGSFLCRVGLAAAIMLLLLVVVIERIIHTTYTITPAGNLEVSYGRFSRRRVIHLADVKRIEKCRRMCVGRHCLFSYLLIVYGNEQYVSVMPLKEDEFLEELSKRCKESRKA